MTQHTPGPWACGGNDDGSWLIQSDPNSHTPPWVYQKGTVAAVAPLPNAAMNARLMSAAPEMLEACRKIEEFFNSVFVGRPLSIDGKPVDHTALNHAHELARQAIAKYEGRL